MTSATRRIARIRASLTLRQRPNRQRDKIAAGTLIVVFSIAATLVVVPVAPPSAAEKLERFINEHAQTMEVSTASVVSTVTTRDGYAWTPGAITLAAEGTNEAWAKLVMVSAGFPATEGNVTVMLRWMRQENGPDSWSNRNNPLNNGWGSGGGGGTGSYPNLVVAAEFAAKSLLSHPGYGGIRAAFAASAPTEQIEQAIWASPWASGHYANGAHWHYSPVKIVKAPADRWGQ